MHGKAALELVKTRFVCVMQHDRTFMRPFHDFLPLLTAMMEDERLKMVPSERVRWDSMGLCTYIKLDW